MATEGHLKSAAIATSGDDNSVHLQPPMWNESQLPYLLDLTPKPTWEIIVKVSRRLSSSRRRRKGIVSYK